MSDHPDTTYLRNLVVQGSIPSLKNALDRSNESVNVVVDEFGKTALHYAVYCGIPNMVKWLIQEGAEVNATDMNQQTPLHMVFPRVNYHKVNLRLPAMAVKYREMIRKEITLTLLKNGADPNIQDGKGSTPLNFAILQRSRCVIELLMLNGAKVTIRNAGNVTPLQVAECVDILDFVLDCYGDLDVIDDDGETLLHKLMRPVGDIYSTYIVQKVLDRGPTVNIPNKLGVTPYYYAMFHIFKYKTVCGRFCNTPTCFYLHLMNKDVLVKHIIKLKEAGVCVEDKDLDVDFEIQTETASKELHTLQTGCREELSMMATIKVHGNTSLNHVFKKTLSKKDSKRPFYLGNKKLVANLEEILNDSDFNILFPLYAEMFQCFYAKSKKRYKLVKNAVFSLLGKNGHQTFLLLRMDQYALEYLIQFLSDADLQNLIESVEMNT